MRNMGGFPRPDRFLQLEGSETQDISAQTTTIYARELALSTFSDI